MAFRPPNQCQGLLSAGIKAPCGEGSVETGKDTTFDAQHELHRKTTLDAKSAISSLTSATDWSGESQFAREDE